MPSRSLPAAPLAVIPLCAAALAAVAGCAPSPQVAVVSDPGPRGRPGLVVAGDDPGAGADIVIVNANVPRTFAGHFRAGQRVRVEVVDTQWTHEPGATFHDAAGVPGTRCASTPEHPCAGGGDAPLLGLLLFVASDVPAGNGPDSTCMEVQRLHIPTGAEFTVPLDADISLGPNDWEDGMGNNRGSINVLVERALNKGGSALERTNIDVSSTSSRTPAGRFRAGEYVRVSVLGGSWSNDPGAPLVGSEGFRDQKCGAVGHVCAGGEGKPLMGLVLHMACASLSQPMMPLQRIERAFIPRGTEIVLEHDADLYLAPNDREDHMPDNSGSARVHLSVVKR